MSFRPSLAAALLFTSLAACAPGDPSVGSDESNVDDDEALGGDIVYIVTRQDFRKCAYPMCGGVYVRAVNKQKTTCSDGSKQDECYVAGIDVGPMALPEAQADGVRGSAISGKILLGGQFVAVDANFAELEVYKAWEPRVMAGDPTGTFYVVDSSGIVCVKAPCPSIRAKSLNTTTPSKNLTGLDFSALGISEEEQSDYAGRVFTTGIIMTGTIRTVSTSEGTEKQLKVTEVFTQVEAKPEPQQLCLEDDECNEGTFCDHSVCLSNCPPDRVCAQVCYGQCSATPPAPAKDSCEAVCGGSSVDGSCFCDEACSDYGDCCADYASFCAN